MSNYDSAEVKKSTKKKEVPQVFIELCDQRDSGWIMDGTAGTPHEVRLTTPSAEFIPNRGYRKIKVKNPETGEMEEVHEAIRYIKNSHVISVEEQNKRGIRPAKNKMEDLIIIKGAGNKGGGNYLAISREGPYIGMYDYITSVFYNESNPDAPSSSKKIFRQVDFNKKAEMFNEQEIAQAEAISYIGTLYMRRGNEYTYNEDKINSLCNIFAVYAESPSEKIKALMGVAKIDPAGFLNRALVAEQTIEMEIGHALDLNVFHFAKNVAQYNHKDKVIADLGRGNMKHENKVRKLAEIFGTDEYKAVYEEFRAELEAAKLKNK